MLFLLFLILRVRTRKYGYILEYQKLFKCYTIIFIEFRLAKPLRTNQPEKLQCSSLKVRYRRILKILTHIVFAGNENAVRHKQLSEA